MRSAVLLALFALTAPARADSPRFQQTFQAGVDAYRLGKYDDARALLESAAQLEPKLPGPHRFLAAVAQAQGRFADCIAAARTALALNPRSAELGDTRKLHEACRASAGRPSYRDDLGEGAAIAVTTSVPGATVTIDGLGYGGTPLAPRRIKPGSHVVEVAKTGYRAANATVSALPGVVTDVDFELAVDESVGSPMEGAPVATGIVIARAPADVVTVDGDRILGAPDVPIGLAPGEHVLEVRREGNEPWRRRVMISPGQRRTLTPQFETARAIHRRRGWLMVGAGTALLLAGGLTLAVGAGGNELETPWIVGGGVAGAASATCYVVGIVWLLRGRADDRNSPPPFAVLPIEGGALATTGFAW